MRLTISKTSFEICILIFAPLQIYKHNLLQTWSFDVVRTTKLALKYTPENILILSNFLVRKFCGKAQFSHSFGQVSQNYAKKLRTRKLGRITVFFELRYFSNYGIFRSVRVISITINKIVKNWKKSHLS